MQNFKNNAGTRGRGRRGYSIRCAACDLPGFGRLAALTGQAQLFQLLRFLPASALLGLDGFFSGSLGIFEAILPVSL